MPKVDLEKLATLLTAEQMDLVKRFLKPDGTIRATKPEVKKVVTHITTVQTEYGPYQDEHYDCVDPAQGKAAYIWRHVVFMVSPKPAHQYLPTMDFCDLPDEVVSEGYLLTNPHITELHRIADIVVDCVPVADWHGVQRWGQAMGQIGTPQIREGGTIVYR